MTIIWRSKTQKAANPGKRLLGSARLTKNERDIADNFMTAVRELTSTVDTSALTRALGSGSINNAVRSFDWGQFGSRLSENRLSLLAQVTESGKASAKELAPVIGNFAFDVTDPRALAWAASRSGEKVVEISQTLQNEIRGMITSSFANQIDPREIAKELELKVGLFDRWGNAVTNSYNKNYSEFLGQGMSPGEAERRATELADAYRERLISARAENIARTEVMTAANQGRLMSWQQAGDKGLVDIDASMKQWIAEGSACDICEGADQDGPIPVNDDWELDNGDTVDMPPGHPSCRCTAVLIPMEPGEGVDQPEEPEQTEGDGETGDTDYLSSYAPAEGVEVDEFTKGVIEDPESARNRYDLNMNLKDDREMGTIDYQYPNAEPRLDEMLGYNGLPSVVSGEQFDKLVAEGAEPFYRGLESDFRPGSFGTERLPVEDALEKVEQFRSGDLYEGQGIYGNGTYFSTNSDTALAYANGESSAVIQAVFHPEAKIITDTDLNSMISSRLDSLEQRLEEKGLSKIQRMDLTNEMALWTDPGRAARVMGYDGIRVTPEQGPSFVPLLEQEKFLVVLNRTSVIVRQ